MNEKFLSLDECKRTAMINSGFKCFSSFGYKKASMADIAQGAGVSKALLFHYFSTKKELYKFLWDFTEAETRKNLAKAGAIQEKDFFCAMEKGLKAKMDLSRKWPDMAMFAVKAYYETDPEVSDVITVKRDPVPAISADMIRKMYPETRFRKGLDLQLMYQEMYYMSEGYVLHESQRGGIDPDKMEKDYGAFLAFWRNVYLEED